MTIFPFFVKPFFIYVLACLLFFSGCRSVSEYQLRDLAKTHIDVVSEIHISQVTSLLMELTQKLYKKNPAELRKAKNQTIHTRLDQIFRCPVDAPVAELNFKTGTDAILLGFDPAFKGDRIFALMFGLYTMIHASYDNKCELFMLDYLNEQSLYNSARNIEIFVWRLKTRRYSDGRLMILTNSVDGPVENLSYERIFGKLISLQDTMALIIAGRTGRIITKAAHFASMTFLPIGI